MGLSQRTSRLKEVGAPVNTPEKEPGRSHGFENLLPAQMSWKSSRARLCWGSAGVRGGPGRTSETPAPGALPVS